MQIGMIGLGRMGANMVRRLLKGGHHCVVFNRSPNAVKQLVQKEKAVVGQPSLADLVRKLDRPRAVWLMVPAAVVDKTIADLLPHLEEGDTLIDGGNSYYVDDILAAPGNLTTKAGSTMSTWARAAACGGLEPRLLHDDRRPGPGAFSDSTRFSATARALGVGDILAHRRGATNGEGNRRAGLSLHIAGYVGAVVTSSRWCITASNTASWPPTPRGWRSLEQRGVPTSASDRTRSTPRRRRAASDPEHIYQYDLDSCRDISGGLASAAA